MSTKHDFRPAPGGDARRSAFRRTRELGGSLIRSLVRPAERKSRFVLIQEVEAALSQILEVPTSSVLQGQTLAIYVPRWRGVSASTMNLFDRCLPVPPLATDHPQDLTIFDFDVYAEAISALPITRLVISGGDLFTLEILRRVRKRRRDIDGRLLWHSNFLQMGEPHDWQILQAWLNAARRSDISTFGVVKKGLDRYLQAFGVSSVFVQNRVNSDYANCNHTSVRNRVGIWLSGSSGYRKVPYDVLCALRELNDVEFEGAGLDDNSLALIRKLGLSHGAIERETLPHTDMLTRISNTALSVYVTKSECMPMLPLESIAAGVPCLIGASSHFLKDDPELADLYVVEELGEPRVIARKIRRALEEGEGVFEQLKRYMLAWNARSVETVEQFLA